MKRSDLRAAPTLLACVALLLTAPTARAAEDGATLAQTLRCQPCHDQTRPLIGPSWQAIAVRYAANKDAMIEPLAAKTIRGGAGAWGVVPMVPNEHVSPEQARVIVRWILDQETGKPGTDPGPQ